MHLRASLSPSRFVGLHCLQLDSSLLELLFHGLDANLAFQVSILVLESRLFLEVNGAFEDRKGFSFTTAGFDELIHVRGLEGLLDVGHCNTSESEM